MKIDKELKKKKEQNDIKFEKPDNTGGLEGAMAGLSVVQHAVGMAGATSGSHLEKEKDSSNSNSNKGNKKEKDSSNINSNKENKKEKDSSNSNKENNKDKSN